MNFSMRTVGPRGMADNSGDGLIERSDPNLKFSQRIEGDITREFASKICSCRLESVVCRMVEENVVVGKMNWLR